MGEHLAGFFSTWIIYAGLLILHLIVPARIVNGYVHDRSTGRPYTYRLNGVLVLPVSVATWALLGRLGILPYDWLYHHRWSALAGAATLGVIASFAIVGGAPRVTAGKLADLFLGRRFNPQFVGRRVDAKMFLYLSGACMLALNILSFTSYHISVYGPTRAVLLYTAMFFWFLIDYMVFEHVHLYTYDLVAERVGFKLVFGCFAFYPYFYPIGLWAVAERAPADRTAVYFAVCGIVFLAGWVLARGANLQKYVFKMDHRRTFLGLFEPVAISDGRKHVLCSGFWGLSRHINYLGEVLMATGLTLSLGHLDAVLAWLYPLYYAALLSTRQADDDRRCRHKYGRLWDTYERKVPWRIIPGIY